MTLALDSREMDIDFSSCSNIILEYGSRKYHIFLIKNYRMHRLTKH